MLLGWAGFAIVYYSPPRRGPSEKCRVAASDRTVARQAQLGVIVAGSQDRGGHLAAVIVSADAVVAPTKAAAVSFFDFP